MVAPGQGVQHVFDDCTVWVLWWLLTEASLAFCGLVFIPGHGIQHVSDDSTVWVCRWLLSEGSMVVVVVWWWYQVVVARCGASGITLRVVMLAVIALFGCMHLQLVLRVSH